VAPGHDPRESANQRIKAPLEVASMISARHARSVVLPLVLSAVYLGGCSRGSSSETASVRLVDQFQAQSVSNSPTTQAPDPAVSWDFSKSAPPAAAEPGKTAEAKDPALGWKAGPGVEDLKIVDGRLTGRTTTDFPLIYAPIPPNVDGADEFHSVDVRIRSSVTGALAVIRSNADKLDFDQIIRQNSNAPPQLSNKVLAGDAFQTISIASTRPGSMAGKYLLVRPVSAKGANFAIEFVRLISQREHRAMVPSGIGWQGLGSVYRESIVSRSPEVFSIDANIPAGSWLDVNLGTADFAPLTFKVTAASGAEEQTILERTITTPQRWEPVAVDLGPFAGQKTLRFSLAVEEERRIGFWGSPVIRVRGAQPRTGNAAAALGGAAPPRGVIFLMCDTLRKDHLGLYGYERETAPHLKQLAEQSAVFLDNVSQATWTKASTPSIMTSLNPLSTQVHGTPDRLSASATTIAEVFRDAGYATVSFSSTGFTGRMTNLHQGFEELHESASIDQPANYRAKTARPYVDRAIEWIEHHPDTPFFMYLHVFDPHHQYEPRAPYASAFNDPALRDEHEKERETSRKFIHEAMRGRGLPNPEELKKAGLDADKWVKYERDWYDGSILGMDAEVGRLIQRLRTLGIEDDTLLVFFSDHGEGFGEHGNMWHGFTGYGEMSGVPMMFHRPGVIPPGLKISETVRNLDLMPTVLDLCGLPIPEAAQGQSLVPLMAAARQAAQNGSQGSLAEIAAKLGWTPQPAVTEKSDDPQGENPKGLLSYAIVSGGWKLVHNVKSPDNRAEYELYHHADDPLDQKNVLDQNGSVAETLKTKLAEWHEMVEKAKLPEGESTEGVDEKELERLRSLGYVQ
jgi:arylsulfatase A-like enzyme